MKKTSSKAKNGMRFHLTTEKVRDLTTEQLAGVAGGQPPCHNSLYEFCRISILTF